MFAMIEKKSVKQLELLKELLKGRVVCLENYATANDISLRTIQRYMKEIREIFVENIEKKGNSYQFISSNILDNLSFTTDELEYLIDILYLVDSSLLKKLDIDSLLSIKNFEKKYSNYYLLKSNNFEMKISKKILNDIKNAIKGRRYVDIKYKSDKEYDLKRLKPIKIIISEGNFYLATVSSDISVNNGFKLLRIKFIENVKILSQTYNRDVQINMFLENFQSLFTNYEKEKYEVIIEVDKSVKRFFENKKFLSSQKIIKNTDDGMTISFSITNDMEILPLVKKWIPNLKIISPEKTRQRLKKELSIYLDTF